MEAAQPHRPRRG